MTTTDERQSGALLVADSFRVRVDEATGAAQVRGLELHLARFADAAHSALAENTDDDDSERCVDAFLADALPRIAAYGAGFPRLELRGGSARDRGPRFDLALRPSPALGEALELRTAGSLALPHADRKGPNIARLAELNRELGAEALLLDGDGSVLEGATTAIVWWTGDALRRAASRERVPSVCEALLRELAERSGVEVREAAIEPAELALHEVWAVNALHGIRVVTNVDGVSPPTPDEHRLRRFREALDGTWQTLPE
ncbi:aminotransferase class IV [Leucobacter ruminantium]|uniref:Aminotransferase class IV n=1 Tax=Leucobacter ruminantium TaxID=1289170 RepID=A0A939M089_9MICO|nr:aminotransferase class IV [Leucobacter ruminantium]